MRKRTEIFGRHSAAVNNGRDAADDHKLDARSVKALQECEGFKGGVCLAWRMLSGTTSHVNEFHPRIVLLNPLKRREGQIIFELTQVDFAARVGSLHVHGPIVDGGLHLVGRRICVAATIDHG